MPDIEKIINKVTDVVDDNIESRQEAEETRTERQRIDSTSPFKLPHLIRPIIALVLLGLEVIVVIADIFGADVPTDTHIALGGLLGAAIGFYFNSRKAEKIAAKKSEAAIQIEKERSRFELKKEKKAWRKQKRARQDDGTSQS